LNSKIPRDLETIALKCLRKEPAHRYTSAAELAEDLRRFRKGAPIKARPAGLCERGFKWIRRHPAEVAWVGVGLLTLAGAVIGVAEFLNQREARDRARAGELVYELSSAQTRSADVAR